MSERTAWLFDFGSGVRAIIGEFNLVHLLHQPERVPVPATPAHCREIVAWNSRLVPIWNLPRWLGIEQTIGENPANIVGVVGFQRRHQAPPIFGAFLLSRPPQRLQVRDADVCPIPEHPSGWVDAALSCIQHEGEPLPILDLRRIFSDSLVNRRSPLAPLA